MSNRALLKAKDSKNDEFYTQICDIESELQHYTDQFTDKIVYCNCDDPFKSNFFKYFVVYFNELKLKKLICTCYDGNPVNHKTKQLFDYKLIINSKSDRRAWKIEITEVDDSVSSDMTNTELIEHTDGKPELLKSNGDFRSAECMTILNQSDIIVSNPPFSLFHMYMGYLIESAKKFLILGNLSALVYRRIFPSIMNGDIVCGYNYGTMKFDTDIKDEQRVFSNICWITNMTNSVDKQFLTLSEHYDSRKYRRYDNYDAIDVGNIKDIPCDYNGVMGVPITFLCLYNTNRFCVVGRCENLDLYNLKTKLYNAKECKDSYFDLFQKDGVYDLNSSGVIDGRKVYQRILIRRKQ